MRKLSTREQMAYRTIATLELERDALQQRLTVAEQRAGELESEVVRLTNLSAVNYEAWFIAGAERDRLKSFAQQTARQQGEPYFSKLAKAALKPAEEVKP